MHFLPEDNYFHLRPGGERTVMLYPRGRAGVFRCSVSAINGYNDIEVF